MKGLEEKIKLLVEDGDYKEALKLVEKYIEKSNGFLPDLREHYETKGKIMERVINEIRDGHIPPNDFYREVRKSVEKVKNYKNDLSAIDKEIVPALNKLRDLASKYNVDFEDLYKAVNKAAQDVKGAIENELSRYLNTS